MNTLSITLSSEALVLTLTACESLTEREEDVSVTLDSFNLIGQSGKRTIRATVTGNPACTARQTNLNSLLAQVDNFDDFDEYLETLDINAVRYRIPVNTTSVEASASMSITDPANGQLTTIASAIFTANSTVLKEHQIATTLTWQSNCS